MKHTDIAARRYVPRSWRSRAEGMASYRRGGLLVLILGVCAAAAATEPLLSPTLLRCVFMENANVTCYWEPAEDTDPGTLYTLQVNETKGLNGSVFSQEQCQTEQNHCATPLLTVSAFYCVSVTAHSPRGNASSARHCLHGTHAVKLYPPVFSSLSGVQGRPRCLNLRWSQPPFFSLSSSEVSAGHLHFQLQYSTAQRPSPQIVDVDLRDKETELCLFSPFTVYNISIRYRYTHTHDYWSDWSSSLQARTEEAAPSAAPQLWRQVEPAAARGWRRVTLLWKPLPPSVANGKVLGYNMSCWVEDDLTEMDLGEYGVLRPSDTSCRLSVPPQRCSCNLSAFNSAGTSPPAAITIPSHEDTGNLNLLTNSHCPGTACTVLPPPVAVSVTPLDDHRLEVGWTAPSGQSASGFIVEWVAVSETGRHSPYWQRLNGTTVGTVITEGVKPEVCYAVSVRALYGSTAGAELSKQVYSREGAPSAGPSLQVKELRSSSVVLQWDPIPIHQRHGFIQNYTVYWKGPNGHIKRLLVRGEQRQCTLTGLSGEYSISVMANTSAGGTAGQAITVAVGRGSLSIPTILCCAVLPLLTVLMVLACLGHRERVRQHLCPQVPDPGKSSLSVWIPSIHWGDVEGSHSQPTLRSPYFVSEVMPQGKVDWQRPLVVVPMLQCGYKGYDSAEMTNHHTAHTLPAYCKATDQDITNYSYWISTKKDRLCSSYTSFCVTDSALPSPRASSVGGDDVLLSQGDLSTFPLLLQFLRQHSDPPPPSTPPPAPDTPHSSACV
ncbi:hypothetical protein MATL_G00240670 [Megalops atlanticus]|uniref:Fibronectin type-III domain-containing protein n=1 Tax=Megalops atlanticus TaxID=7932 RepID=A0A9D3PCE2_MEGAT|nr:hypothetical protein MATL_G00240670 [Megalops atlanticus]